MNNRENLFIQTLDNKFRMISRDELLNKVQKEDLIKPVILDFRGKSAFEKSHIKNSINLDIKDLHNRLYKFSKSSEIVAVCNGSIQSGYAIFYLYMNGFEKVYNLSGGYSGCEKNNFPLLEISQN